jgi:hypothetical protein
MEESNNSQNHEIAGYRFRELTQKQRELKQLELLDDISKSTHKTAIYVGFFFWVAIICAVLTFIIAAYNN